MSESLTTAMERHAERMGLHDHGRVDVSGLGGSRLTGEMSSGDQRLIDRVSMAKRTAHRATSPKRFQVKPNAGKLPDTEIPVRAPGEDDGTAYFREPPIPKCKTAHEDRLAHDIRRWNEGSRTEERREAIVYRLQPIRKRNPERAAAFEKAWLR